MGRRLTQEELLERGRRRCHACNRIRPLEDFYNDAKGKGGKGYRCKTCAKRIARKDYQENHDARSATNKQYRSRPDIRARTRNRLLVEKYGVTADEYDALLARQKGVCAVCLEKRRDVRGREMPVDHDHVSGKVRGILCDNCNRILGLFQDDPRILRSAAKYLQKWSGQV